MAGSVWWYTCRIKDNCIGFSRNETRGRQELLIDLDGEEKLSFFLRDAGNGIMQIVPGEKGSGIGMIRAWLDQHPGQEIDLVASNTDQANGLLAMLIISGVPNDRVNVYEDASLGSKERPMTIRSTARSDNVGEDTLAISDQAVVNAVDQKQRQKEGAADSDRQNRKEEPAGPEKTEPAPVVPKTVQEKTIPAKTADAVYAMPCPEVDLSGEFPTIGTIYYPVSASAVRCSSKLSGFAFAALKAMVENDDLNIVITGFTDNDKEMPNSYQLALQRAIEMKKYLIKAGIPGHRIETYSRGSDTPAGDNNTEEGKMLNRRVTIEWK